MIMLYQNVKKFLEDNVELLDYSPNELIRKSALELSIHEIA